MGTLLRQVFLFGLVDKLVFGYFDVSYTALRLQHDHNVCLIPQWDEYEFDFPEMRAFNV